MRRHRFIALACVGLSLMVAACSSSNTDNSGAGGTGGTTSNKVMIYSWWTAPGEAEALQALLSVHKAAYPDDRINNAAIESGEVTRTQMVAAIAAGDPPDLFQGNAHDVSAFLTDNPGTLEPLDSFLKDEGLDKVIMPEVLKDVTVNGAVYAMPNNIHRENTLLYNKAIFSANGVTPPTTVNELLASCAKLKAAGVTPIATSHQGWILRIMFNSLAMSSMGAKAFHDYMVGGPRDDTAFGAAVDLMDNVLTNYVNADAGNADFGWTNAADSVMNGSAAMFFHGDWAKGYFVQMGWTPGTDFGVVPPPGATDLFWYGVDDFSMPKGGPNPEGARRFLRSVASKEGQVAFNRLKGSTPFRTDIPVSELDSEGRATFAEFKAATYKMLVVGKDAWDTAWATFAKDRDKAAIMKAYADNPPAVQ